jgi:hypothetical protein
MWQNILAPKGLLSSKSAEIGALKIVATGQAKPKVSEKT